jgi:hypothetical protein
MVRSMPSANTDSLASTRRSDACADGRRQIVGFAYPGDLIGLGAQGEHVMNAQAIKPTRLRCVPVGTLHQSATPRPTYSASRPVPLRCTRFWPLAGWLDQQLKLLSGKSELAGAIRYARSRWDALMTYVDDGRLEISNNAAENAIRPVTLGRKNWLFAGSDAGGERAAIFYTLIRSAKLNGLESEAWLRDVLTRIGEHPVNRLDELLPWNMAQPATHSVAA